MSAHEMLHLALSCNVDLTPPEGAVVLCNTWI